MNLHTCATVANMMYIMLSIYNLYVHHSKCGVNLFKHTYNICTVVKM